MNKTGKLGLVLVVVALLVLLPASLVSADAKGNLKGPVSEIIDETTFTVTTSSGQVVTVTVPEGYDISFLEVEMTVLVKGQWLNDTDYKAEWVKQIEMDGEETEETEDGEDTFQNAFCTGAKETNHPLAAKIVAKYGEATGVTEEQVMSWFCEDHFSFGQIMLALTTHILDPDSDPGDILNARKEGQSWGKIWKDKFLIGSEREGMPPGWAKKPDKGIPPGQLKKTPTP